MHFRYRQDQQSVLKEYHQPRRIEAFFSRYKRRFGSFRSRIGTKRCREVWVKILVLNILIVAGDQAEEELKVAG